MPYKSLKPRPKARKSGKNLRKSNLNLLRLKTYKNSEKSQRSSPTFRGHGKSTVAVPPSTRVVEF